jgi:asparagine synthase (glutamine-hydrolysing)
MHTPHPSGDGPRSGDAAGLQRVLEEPWFRAVQQNGRADVQGQAHVFRGHRIARPDGTADGIFAEWDWDGRTLSVRNDRHGFHPLFYCAGPNEVAVSTSLVRLLAAGAPTEIDTDALAVFLRLGFFVGEDTPFRAIRVVPPDATFEWVNGRLSVSGGYWYGKPQGLSRDAALDAYVSLFRRAVERRVPPNDNFVVPLSGGRDSRHILLELCRIGRRPRSCMTIPRYPPRAPEDERVAAILAAAAGVPHRLLDQPADRVSAELRKNWQTHLCADEHAWYMHMIDVLESEGASVYDGMGGALSVASRFLSASNLRLFHGGRFEELAEAILTTFGVNTDKHLGEVVSAQVRTATGRGPARRRARSDKVVQFLEPDPPRDRAGPLCPDEPARRGIQPVPGSRRLRAPVLTAADDAVARPCVTG